MLRKLSTLINSQSKDNKQYYIPENKMANILGTTAQRKKRYTDTLFAKLTLLELRIIQFNRASNILARKYCLVYSSILGSIVPGPRQADASSLI
jgi:hypothetical protein